MGRRYLYPAPPREAEVLESDLGGLVVPVGLAPKLEHSRLRGIWVERLNVLDKALDNAAWLDK
jgi:hypothetical protein